MTEQECECSTWAITEPPKLWLSHHRNCPKSDIENEVRGIIEKLLNDINIWAIYGNGVPDDIWESYVAASRALGREVMFVKTGNQYQSNTAERGTLS